MTDPRQPPAPRIGALAPLLLLPLLGCRPTTPPAAGQAPPLRSSIVMAVGINNDDRIDGALLEDLNRQIGELTRSFRTLHPGVRLEVQPFQEERLAEQLRRRSRDGLAPDLLLVNGTTANVLAQKGLIRPVRLPASVTDQINPGALSRARRADGRLIGLPVLLNPQLACFDRRRVSEPPATLQALLGGDGSRIAVGLPIDAVNLAWTLGPLGALDTITTMTSGQPVSAAGRQRLQVWLEWLGTAHLQPGLHFYADQNELREGLASGRLDWIPCRSTHIRRLQRRLGSHLGVSVLPSGPNGPASPITRERLLVFGINSTADQRRAAESLALFSINPLVQRMMTLRDLQTLPANRNLRGAEAGSPLLVTLMAARDQGTAIDGPIGLVLNSDAGVTGRFRQLLTRFLFGEIDARTTVEALIRGLSREVRR